MHTQRLMTNEADQHYLTLFLAFLTDQERARADSDLKRSCRRLLSYHHQEPAKSTWR